MKTLQEQIFETLEGAKLNWEIVKEPLLLATDSKPTPFFGMVRSDNRETFGTCRTGYEPYQNKELIELAYKISDETSYKLDTAKSFGSGNRVGVDLKTKPALLEYAKVGDVMNKSIRLTNTHDGTGSLRLALHTVVLSCTNGQTHWVKDRATSIRHTKNMRVMIDQALRGIDIIKKADISLMEQIERMIEINVTAEQVNTMVKEIGGVDTKLVRTVGEEWISDDYSTKALNRTKSLFDSIRSEMDEKGNTVWGLLNGVTHFTTHKAGRGNTRDASKVFGSLMRTDKTAFDLALEMI